MNECNRKVIEIEVETVCEDLEHVKSLGVFSTPGRSMRISHWYLSDGVNILGAMTIKRIHMIPGDSIKIEWPHLAVDWDDKGNGHFIKELKKDVVHQIHI